MAITQWDLHDSLCQGGPSSEQSDSGDCVDLTGNDESARPVRITKPEGVRIEHNPDCSLTDENATVSVRGRGDLRSNDCLGASSSKNGKGISDHIIYTNVLVFC